MIAQRRALSFVFLALSFLSKFFPAALLPAFLATVQRAWQAKPGGEIVAGVTDPRPEAGHAPVHGRGKAMALPEHRNKALDSGGTGSLPRSVGVSAVSATAKMAVPHLWAYTGIFAAVVFIVYLPYVGAGRGLFAGLSKYAAIWEANDSFFRLLLLAGNTRDQAKLVAGVILLGLLVYVIRKRMELLRGCLFLIASLLLLSSNAFPWYFTWSIPFLCFYPVAPWLLMSVTAVLGYAPVVPYAAGQPYIHSPFILTLEYAPVYLWLAYAGWREICRESCPRTGDPTDFGF